MTARNDRFDLSLALGEANGSTATLSWQGLPGAGGGGASDPRAISYAGHLAQLKDFVKAVVTEGRPLVDGEEGRKSVEIILAIYKSAKTGRRVTVTYGDDKKATQVVSHRPAKPRKKEGEK